MIACLPAVPGYASVRRIDWMISRALRSYTPSANALSGRSRDRTSCWVMVEPPRSLPWIVSTAAAAKAMGSKPEFSQNVLSSIAVVASTRTGGIWSNVTISRRSEPRRASSTLPVRSQTAVCSSKSMLSRVFLGSGRSFAR